jgi:2-polyprenyl-3-methyl-5-hydroxy-6-metoxy-1,4-benzoquinol methylase
MSVPSLSFPSAYEPKTYWDDRARRFAARGEGLAAVCSYGMPAFYNGLTHAAQRLALAKWLRVAPGTRALDVGCGVGRWSRLLASRGVAVTGVDLSGAMIAEAERRAAKAGVAYRCRFLVQDAAALDAGGTFDLVLAVTVLQHILDPAALSAAVERMADHLAPGGRMILLEVAPETLSRGCDSTVFKARSRAAYLRMFMAHGLDLHALTGVDPAPLPCCPGSLIPKPLATAALVRLRPLGAQDYRSAESPGDARGTPCSCSRGRGEDRIKGLEDQAHRSAVAGAAAFFVTGAVRRSRLLVRLDALEPGAARTNGLYPERHEHGGSGARQLARGAVSRRHRRRPDDDRRRGRPDSDSDSAAAAREPTRHRRGRGPGIARGDRRAGPELGPRLRCQRPKQLHRRRDDP